MKANHDWKLCEASTGLGLTSGLIDVIVGNF